MCVWVGTSGWHYDAWRGALYADGVPKRRWLETYAASFATVELNNAFYRLPPWETFAGWRDALPPDFTVAVKASRFLTHIKRLRDSDEPVHRLMTAARGLGEQLGPILLQLPPTMTAEPNSLATCLDAFPPGQRVAVEPRHPSWWTDEVRDVLSTRGAALCWTDRRGRVQTPLWRTASWGYVRLHEGAARDWPRYGERALRSWVTRVVEVWPVEADVYVYFNNDPNAAAVFDAERFARLARRAGRDVSRSPSTKSSM